VRLIPVDPDNETHLKALYDLLAERTPEQSISHKRMPTWEEHCAFVASEPYEAWYVGVHETGVILGAVYLTRANEVGVAIRSDFRGRDHGILAVYHLMRKHGPRRYLANINPANGVSAAMFRKLGFKLVQHTYALEPAA
jgi:RimJ/RimL family protein N-acetyltransferase